MQRGGPPRVALAYTCMFLLEKSETDQVNTFRHVTGYQYAPLAPLVEPVCLTVLATQKHAFFFFRNLQKVHNHARYDNSNWYDCLLSELARPRSTAELGLRERMDIDPAKPSCSSIQQYSYHTKPRLLSRHTFQRFSSTSHYIPTHGDTINSGSFELKLSFPTPLPSPTITSSIPTALARPSSTRSNAAPRTQLASSSASAQESAFSLSNRSSSAHDT